MKSRTLGQIRIATLLLPPLGLLWLWGTQVCRLRTKVLGTLGIILYGAIYCAACVFLLLKFGGMEIEFRGGYIPAFTFHKTRPDYEALAASRKTQPPPVTPIAGLSDASTYWDGFRGPKRDGHYMEQLINTNWPREGLKPLWRQPIGGGYASFAIAGGRAFTIEQRRDQEVAVAYDVVTGREIWTQAWKAEFKEELGGDGPRATPSVVWRACLFSGGAGRTALPGNSIRQAALAQKYPR